MNNVIEIKLNKLFNNELNTRESANYLFDTVQKLEGISIDTIVELNFINIDSMARSFADEFHKNILNSQYNFEFINCNNSILNILKAVEKTQITRKSVNIKSKVFYINDLSSLKDVALTW